MSWRQHINYRIGEVIKTVLRPAGYTLAPLKRRAEYIDASETITAAAASGLSVPDYVARLWNEEGVTAQVLAEMEKAGALAHCARVAEIGPGTGRYLVGTHARVLPGQYDVYELDDAWAEHLTTTYPATRQPTDGETLSGTPDGSCGLVTAHNVFVYLKPLVAFRYFLEMIRVCAPGGYIVFDFFPDEAVTEEILLEWLTYPERYQVLLSRRRVLEFFAHRGCHPVHSFDNRCFRGTAQYIVFRRDSAEGASTPGN